MTTPMRERLYGLALQIVKHDGPKAEQRAMQIVDAILVELREPEEIEPHEGPLYAAAAAIYKTQEDGTLEGIGFMRGTYILMSASAAAAITAYVDAVREGK